MRRLRITSVLLSVLATAFTWSPGRTHACTCDQTPINKFDADPKDGAMDVPINKAPVIEGAFELGSVTVEDGLGQRVDVTINEGPSGGCPGTWAEIIPKQPWEPRTIYIVRVQPIYSAQGSSDAKPLYPPEAKQLAFVTGIDSLPESPLATPKVHVSMLTDLPVLTCGMLKTRTCLNVEGQSEGRKDVELIARRGDKLLLRRLLSSTDPDYGFYELPDCLELRRRSSTGARSAPWVACGSDLHAKKYEQRGDEFEPLMCEDGMFVPEGPPDDGLASVNGRSNASRREYGCNAVQGRAANAGNLLLIAATLLFSAARRRRTP